MPFNTYNFEKDQNDKTVEIKLGIIAFNIYLKCHFVPAQNIRFTFFSRFENHYTYLLEIDIATCMKYYDRIIQF